MRFGFAAVAGAMLAASLSGVGIQTTAAQPAPSEARAVLPKPQRVVKRKAQSFGRGKSKVYRSNGKREIARRLRQIAAGQITRANGLVA